MPDHGDIVRTLNEHVYQYWDVTWFKVVGIQAQLDWTVEFFNYETDEVPLLRDWLGGKGEALAVAHYYVNKVLRSHLPEDSLWDELCVEVGAEIRWHPLSGSPEQRLDDIVRFNYFHGDEPLWREDTCRIHTERAPTAAEREWYRYAREAFFTLFPPDRATFFEPRPLDERTAPWDVPQALLAISRAHAGIAMVHGHLTEADYRAAIDRVD